MGQKTNPIGLRLGVIRSWNSKWFAQKSFAQLLEEDLKIRRYIGKRLENAGLAKVEIGENNGRVAQLLSGLNQAEKVITHPSDAIEDGVAVTQR